MRRCLHCLVVGLLVVSLSVDIARACGHAWIWSPCPPVVSSPIVIVVEDDWGWCGPVDAVVDCGCDEMAVSVACGAVTACCREIDDGAPLDACGSMSVEVVAPVELASVVVSGDAIAPEPAPTLAPHSVAEPVPATAAPEPLAALPSLEPVEPASAAEPAADAAPEPVPPAVPDTQPAAPAARNAFEEADALGRAPGPDGLEPVIESPESPPPAAEPQAVLEPFRRWIDDTASYAVVGRLVDVRGDRVEILKADGRSVTVPLDRLSGCDRGYVATATPRIAGARLRGPLPTDTVGR